MEPLSFRSAPAFCAALLFAAGILLEHFVWRGTGLIFVTVAIALAASLLSVWRASRLVLLPFVALWLGVGYFCAQIEPRADPQAKLISLAEDLQRAVEGEVVRTGPVKKEAYAATYGERTFAEKTREELRQQIDVKVSAVEDYDATTDQMLQVGGGLRLTAFALPGTAFPAVECGDRIHATLVMHEPQRYMDPGVWNARDYLRDQGIGVTGSVALAKLQITKPDRKRPSLRCLLSAAQQAASTRLIAFADSQAGSNLPPWLRLNHNDAAMLSAMIAGDRSYLDRSIRVGFERTGSFHLLVVSGMHLAIVAGLIFWLASLLRVPRAWATGLTIGLSFGYALLTGFGQPVQRAFWMVTIYLVARLLFREKNALNAIGVAALCLLAHEPKALMDAGFQMTLLSVVAIAGVAAPLIDRSFGPYLQGMRNFALLPLDASLAPRVAQFRVTMRMVAAHLRPLTGRWIAFGVMPWTVRVSLRVVELLVVSLVVEAVMTLPMAIYFHRVTLAALPVNFLMVPLAGLLLPSALLTLGALLMSAKAAAFPAAVTALVLHGVTAMVHAFGTLPGADLRVPGPAMAGTAGYVVLLAASVWAVRRSRWWAATGCVALVLAACVVLLPRAVQHRSGVLEVEAIDVGQGDSLLVITPEGKTLLVDAGGFGGGMAPTAANFDIGADVVSPVLWSRGIARLDAVALSHAHSDHMGGMPAVLENFRPRELWVGHNPDSPDYDALLADAARLGTTVRQHTAGDAFEFGGVQVRVLSPARDYRPEAQPKNDDSMVLRLGYGETSALLEGDAETPSERRMLQAGGLHSDLLKVGHHGSRTSTIPPFLKAVGPSYAVISAGRRNNYGHPRPEVLEELGNAHVLTYRTDTLGASCFFLDGKRVTAATAAGD